MWLWVRANVESWRKLHWLRGWVMHDFRFLKMVWFLLLDGSVFNEWSWKYGKGIRKIKITHVSFISHFLSQLKTPTVVFFLSNEIQDCFFLCFKPSQFNFFLPTFFVLRRNSYRSSYSMVSCSRAVSWWHSIWNTRGCLVLKKTLPPILANDIL